MAQGRPHQAVAGETAMKDHPCRSTIGRAVWRLVLLAAGAACLAAGPASAQVLYEDARISGRELHAFLDQGRDVLVVLGDFALNAGSAGLSGRDAVIWIAPQTGPGMANRHRIIAYVEGQVRQRRGGQSSAAGNSLLTSLDLEGKISIEGELSQQPLTDFPLYQRALEARQVSKTPATAPAPPPGPRAGAPSQPAPGEAGAPASAGTEDLAQLATTATGQPAGAPSDQAAPGQQDLPTSAPAEVDQAPAASAPASQPAQPQALQYVNYFADQTSMTEMGEGDAWRRVIVLRGNVYVSQGSVESGRFLELRSQSAVIFRRRATGQEAVAQTPYAPQVTGQVGQEIFDGVYLEGDVVISRGERTLRGPVAYYDLASGRALMYDVVFRTVQEQRNIPVYIRAKEARILSDREISFRNAKLTSSDFKTPSYALSARSIYLKDAAPYDATGERLGPPQYETTLRHFTWDIYGLPVFYWPYTHTSVEQGHTPLRKLSIGSNGDFGWGVETQWHLFRLLGLVQPEGFRGLLDLNYYERGLMGGPSLHYARRDFSGYSQAWGVIDNRQEDDFGDDRQDIVAPRTRGRVLARHKQYLPDGWLAQAELAYVSDENFMEEYFPAEHFAGKEQETLLYVRKQQDNWALTALLQYRMNRFDTQTESAPDLGFYLIGQPLLNDTLTFYSEDHAGLVRWRPDRALDDRGTDDSDWMQRLDTRNEIDVPLHAGALNLMPYATGRLTNWGDEPTGGERNRAYGQVGLRANTHLWRVYNNASSRLLDVNRLRHVITPEATAFASDNGGVGPDKLFPMDPSIEQHLIRMGGGAVGLYQRLQTQRGVGDKRHTVDWMRLDLVAMFFDTNQGDGRTSNGDFFWYRPEYSLPRNSLNGRYSWQISDATAFLSHFNYDLNRGVIGQADAGIAISRNPRARYYAGWRWLRDLNSNLGTFGLDYQLTRKYTLSAFEQYDFRFDNGTNMATNVSLVRKFERWFAGVTVTYIQHRSERNDLSVMLTLFPEGVPELRLGSQNLDIFGASERN
jgi:hypothetical protein